MPIKHHNNYDENQKLKSTSETTVDKEWGNKEEIQHVKLDNGGLDSRVSDFDAQGMLNNILKELKIMNIHLAIITDNYITKQEVE